MSVRHAAQCRCVPVDSDIRPHVGRLLAPEAHAGFARLSKLELHAMADALQTCEPVMVQSCVDFVLAETRGLWHGRARAMMCRRLKHCDVGRTHRTALVHYITGRLVRGLFSEQFKDQLRLALHLDLEGTLAICRACLESPKPYVRRYAEWATSLPRLQHAP